MKTKTNRIRKYPQFTYFNGFEFNAMLKYCKDKEITKSEFIRKAVQEFLEERKYLITD